MALARIIQKLPRTRQKYVLSGTWAGCRFLLVWIASSLYRWHFIALYLGKSRKAASLRSVYICWIGPQTYLRGLHWSRCWDRQYFWSQNHWWFWRCFCSQVVEKAKCWRQYLVEVEMALIQSTCWAPARWSPRQWRWLSHQKSWFLGCRPSRTSDHAKVFKNEAVQDPSKRLQMNQKNSYLICQKSANFATFAQLFLSIYLFYQKLDSHK